jgi:DNA invertase Pin-like site-specific DNA recombinase
MAVTVERKKRVIEASAAPSGQPATEGAARSRPKASGSRAVKAAKVRRLLTDSTDLTREEVARKAGVSVSTVDRIKRDMPTPLHRRTGT